MQTVVKRINSYRALSGSERRVLATTMMLLPLFWLGLRVAGFARFNRWLDGSPPTPDFHSSIDELMNIGRIVNIAARHTLARGNCLTRSLVLRWILRRRNVGSDLRIGVRLVNGYLEAHAWVEYNGKPINDSADVAERYAAFAGNLSAEAFSTR